MDMKLAGKKTLVVGASSGIGLETARLFAAAGAQVAIAARSGEKLRNLARELGGSNIHVNSVTPGAVMTEGEIVHANSADLEEIKTRQCLYRRIMPADIANACLFLSSPLSDGMTGQNLNVDGGLVMY